MTDTIPTEPVPAETPVVPVPPVAPTVTTVVNKLVNNDTAVGKSGKVALWSGLAVLVVAIITAALTTITGNPMLFSWHSGVLVILANVLLVFMKNLFDKNTPNF